MRVSVNINPILHGNKSGIGYYQTEILKGILGRDADNEYCLNYFDAKNRGRTPLPEWIPSGCRLQCCKAFPMSVYMLVSAFIHIPYSWLFRYEPDVSLFFNFYLPPGVKGKKILVVYDTVIKDLPETVKGRNKLLLELNLKRSIRQADVIVTISKFSKEQIVRHFGTEPDKIVVIPCAADMEKFHPYSAEEVAAAAGKYDLPDRYFMYLGTLEPRKNIPNLIKAYSIAKSREERLPKMVIAGGKGWLYGDIFESVRKYSLEEDIIFPGYIDDADVPRLMSGAVAFCFPSLYEGFGMPPLEAMACGTPVITSDCTSLPEVVGEAAVLVDPLSAKDIADALIKVSSDEAVRRKMSEEGLRRCREFSWEKNADLFLEQISGK